MGPLLSGAGTLNLYAASAVNENRVMALKGGLPKETSSAPGG